MHCSIHVLCRPLDEDIDGAPMRDDHLNARATASDHADVRRDASPGASRAMNEERRAKLREIEV